MYINGIKQLAKSLGGFIQKNSPTILTSLGVGGLLTTVILAIRATPKAIMLLEDKRYEAKMEDPDFDDFSKIGIFRTVWTCYIPTIAVGAATMACIIGANHVSYRRNAALASVYSLTETALKEYQSKVVETFGSHKEEHVRDDISADRIKQNPIGMNEVIFTGKGEHMCYDSWSGRYFKSDIDKIKQSINDLNEQLISSMYLTLNEFYYALGMSGTKSGDELGWHIDKGQLRINFTSQLTDDGTPCLVLDYSVQPRFL